MGWVTWRRGQHLAPWPWPVAGHSTVPGPAVGPERCGLTRAGGCRGAVPACLGGLGTNPLRNALAGGEGTPAPPGRRQRWVSGQLPCWSSDRDRWRQGWPQPHAGPYPGHGCCRPSGRWDGMDPAQGCARGSVPGGMGWQGGTCHLPAPLPTCLRLREVFPSARGCQPGLEAFTWLATPQAVPGCAPTALPGGHLSQLGHARCHCGYCAQSCCLRGR